MLRGWIDVFLKRFPRIREFIFMMLPFSAGGCYGAEWRDYLQHDKGDRRLNRLLDECGRKLVARMVYRRTHDRFTCTVSEMWRYYANARIQVPYWFPAANTMVKSVFAYSAGCSYLPFVPSLRGRCVIDGGAASGDSSLVLSEYGARVVYAFEPSPVQRAEIEEVISKNGKQLKITIVPFAISDGRRVLRFVDQHANSFEAETVAIDMFAADKDVGLIKLDIEGEEFAAMRGAEETIRRCRPILLICVYHRPKDLFELPVWFHETFSGYRFVIRDTEPANKGAGVHLMMIAWPMEMEGI